MTDADWFAVISHLPDFCLIDFQTGEELMSPVCRDQSMPSSPVDSHHLSTLLKDTVDIKAQMSEDVFGEKGLVCFFCNRKFLLRVLVLPLRIFTTQGELMYK